MRARLSQLEATKATAERLAEHSNDQAVQSQHAEIDASALTLHEQIGVGSFRQVYRATLAAPTASVVAAMRVRAADMAAEIRVLMVLGKHPRLVRHLGICHTFPFPDGPRDDTLLIAEFVQRLQHCFALLRAARFRFCCRCPGPRRLIDAESMLSR